MSDQAAPQPTTATAPDFPPVVFHYTDALRYLREHGPLDIVTMADGLKRVRSNAKRDALKLAEAGVVTYDGATITLTDLGRQWVAGQDVAQGLLTAGQGGEPGSSQSPLTDTIGLLHDQIVPDPHNPRRNWDTEDALADLESLRLDIAQNGLLQNLMVRPVGAQPPLTAALPSSGDDLYDSARALVISEQNASTSFVQRRLQLGYNKAASLIERMEAEGVISLGDRTGKREVLAANVDVLATSRTLPSYIIVGGERRWRAIGLMIEADEWAADSLIACRLIETDDTGVRIAALSENLQRRDLNPLEKAHGFEGLAEAGLSNQDIADRFGKTPEHIQQHRRFLQLDEADQQRMTLSREDPRRLGVKEARLKLAAQDKANAPPPELPVSPTARLLLAELMHAARTRADHTYGDIEVGPEAIGNAAMRELIEAHEVRPCELRNYGSKIGRYVTALGHAATFAAFPWARNGDDELAIGLAAEQEAFGRACALPFTVTDATPYLTPWLNGPHALTAEGQAAIDSQAAAAAQNAELIAANVAARDAAIARGQAAADRARSLFATADAPPAEIATPTVFVEIATEAGARLPWRIASNGDAVDADGEVVISPSGHPRSEARVRLMVLATNAAGGLETPEDEPPEPEQDINGDDSDDADADADADEDETFPDDGE